MSVLAAIGILALLILVHELGHFLAARLQGIHVNRFSIGFGPVLVKYQGPETEYAIRAFPLGGFVGFPDDDPDSTISPDDPDLLRNRPILDRAIVISAGVIANLVFAYLLLVVQAGTIGFPQASAPGVVVPGIIAEVAQVSPPASRAGIQPGDFLALDGEKLTFTLNPDRTQGEVLAESSDQQIQVLVNRKADKDKLELKDFYLTPKPGNNGKGQIGVQFVPGAALKAGIRPGDVIVSANGHVFGKTPLREEAAFRQIIQASAGKPVQLEILRGQESQRLTVIPEASPTGEGRVGVSLRFNGKVVQERVQGLQVFGTAADRFQTIVEDTFQGFSQLIKNFSKTANQVAGPVKIVAEGAKIAASNAIYLFDFAALISINLAIINILPLPALDGGQLAFLLIEGLRGKPLPTHIQDGVMQTGLMLLLGLGIFLIIRDTANLIPQ